MILGVKMHDLSHDPEATGYAIRLFETATCCSTEDRLGTSNYLSPVEDAQIPRLIEPRAQPDNG